MKKDCPKCGKPMRYDSSMEIWQGWVCDPCDDKAIARANARAEWDYYHPKEGSRET